MGLHTKTRSKLASAVARVCMEQLEDRQMLTTLQGGDTFIYKDSATSAWSRLEGSHSPEV